ncbi:methyltransferase domain-containing protein [Sphingomonas jatrophae]|uniref:Tocopherol O-methyltransferase n=1 Tax=Sphingomonas jatrophae TaxID=1166337 RepID=A0A1I6LBS8_9SPHN|nr:methyltransferase domain-containing protein [Sphingomonas jatrophae]SFS00916.1 tocopherol O-methyltransferase [Sphingomonas jatrophae]
MIEPRTRQSPADVAGHYDELDHIYRAVWGEHVHHGLWTSGRETSEEATEALSLAVADRLGLRGGEALVDIGCGYGATAALFARRFDARVTGFSLSPAQVAVAAARGDARLSFHVRDWLDNRLPDANRDGAYAIESSEHIADKPAFFAEAARVLKPSARFVVCAWIAADRPTRWQVDHLLEPICREGRLPGMGTEGEYVAMAEAAGFGPVKAQDVSDRVARTWTICLRRFLVRLTHDAAARRVLRHGRDRAFALSVPRLIWAYRSGAMRYIIFTFERRSA